MLRVIWKVLQLSKALCLFANFSPIKKASMKALPHHKLNFHLSNQMQFANISQEK